MERIQGVFGTIIFTITNSIGYWILATGKARALKLKLEVTILLYLIKNKERLRLRLSSVLRLAHVKVNNNNKYLQFKPISNYTSYSTALGGVPKFSN